MEIFEAWNLIEKIPITLFILCTLQVHLQIVLGAQICLNFLSMGYRSLFGSNDHEGKVSKSRMGTTEISPQDKSLVNKAPHLSLSFKVIHGMLGGKLKVRENGSQATEGR